MTPFAPIVAAAMIAAPQPQGREAVRSAAAPGLSILVVATRGTARHLGMYVPTGVGADYAPWHSIIEQPVTVEEHLSGPAYSSRASMIQIAHAPYRRGVRLLVVAEPIAGGSSFRARWTVAGRRGRYCVPETVVTELNLRGFFAEARRRRDQDAVVELCFYD